VTAERLVELPETAAMGSIADLYADIRAVLGLPMVNLVYRSLATKPGVLEDCWAALRPNLASTAATSAAGELVALAAPAGVIPLPRATVADAGLRGERVALARATLAAYRRANSLNLLGMFVLLDGCPGTDGPADAAPAPAAERILPIVSLESLAPETTALLDKISVQTVGGGEPRIVPSLLRHFADNARLLELLWTVLEPATADAGGRALGITRRARELAHGLPYPVAVLEGEPERSVVAKFPDAMARMLVLGELLSAALVGAE
jgi:hypothetical protein